ncbi:MAG: glycosyltransferase family 2 protein [Eubacterium sp.]|nr:glycosyltransferase family 2 protein [Eubacterium sp.]
MKAVNEDEIREIAEMEEERQALSQPKKLLILIPAYNEEKNLEKVIADVREAVSGSPVHTDILVVNDGSTDGTADIIYRTGVDHTTNVYNMGYGSCLQVGYKYAVRRGYQFVIQMDGDGQHDVCNIPCILKELEMPDQDGYTPDIVLGCRFMPGSTPFPVSPAKKFAYWWFRKLIGSVTSRKDIYDPTTGLQGLNRRAFAFYSMCGHFDVRFPDANMLTQMLLLDFRIRQIPAVMHARTAGKSMHTGLLSQADYMIHMTLSLWAVGIRVNCLRLDRDSAALMRRIYPDNRVSAVERDRFFDM